MNDLKDPSLYSEVFNERAAILTFFGALGGSVRAAVLKTSLFESIRVVFIGAAVAFGVGVLGPQVLSPWIGDLPDGMSGTLGALTATSFMIGLMGVAITERLISGESLKPLDPSRRNYTEEPSSE